MTRKNTARKADQARPTASPRRRSAPPVTLLPEDEALDGAPPLAGKARPADDMDDAVPTLDDDLRREHHHPGDSIGLVFAFDPESGDAAADLACELGSQVVEGATRVEDMSDRVVTTDDELDVLPMIIDEELGAADENDEPGPESGPRSTIIVVDGDEELD